jgi:hypothetical protein
MELELVKRMRERNNYHPIFEHALKVIAERHVKGLETTPNQLLEEIKQSEHYEDAFNRAKFTVEKNLKPVDKSTREFLEAAGKNAVEALIQETRKEFSETEVLSRILKTLENSSLIETIWRTSKLAPTSNLSFFKIKKTLDARKVLSALKSEVN